MKKLAKLLTLTAACGALVLGTASMKHSKETNAQDYEYYIHMDAGFFTNWTDAAGRFEDVGATFWDENYSFEALGAFYRGEAAEGWQGTLTSRTWRQYTPYIYFQFGGAKDYDVTGDPVHLNIYYGNHQTSVYNNTFVENPMVLRYFQIPESIFNELTAGGDGFDMHIEIVDYQGSGYGFANFGFLHVNQTEESVSNAMRFYINHLSHDSREWEVNKRKQILDQYYYNADLKRVFYRTVNDISDNFESNSEFLDFWYFDYNYAADMNWDLHFDRAIAFDSVRPDENTNMLFNKTNNGYFKGWFENGDVGGFVDGNSSRYRFVSRPFVLKGTGLVSIKMAGKASLHVIDTATRSDLVWADSLTFNRDGDQVNLANSDFNTVTMVRHFINLEAYLGRTIQLAIADVGSGDWEALYADELVTYYESYPGFKVDTFAQTNTSGTFNGYFLDKYINATVFNDETNSDGLKYVLENDINNENEGSIKNHVDNSAVKEAYNFLQTYYSKLRSPANEFNFVAASEEDKTAVTTAYGLLSHAAKEIVDASVDLEYNATFTNEWWNNLLDVTNEVSHGLKQLTGEITTHLVNFNSNGGTGSMTSVMKDEGSKYTLPENGFVAPSGYKFIGWKVNGAGEKFEVGSQITVNAEVTLYAQWETTFEVSFDSNGGNGTMGSVVVEEGSTYKLPECDFEAPERCQFAGWKVQGSDTLLQPGDEIVITENVTLVAQWEHIYVVSFVSNGGSGTMASIEKVEGSTYTLPQCKFRAPSGKEFDGWKVGSDETLKQPGETITIISDVVITAEWKLLPIVTHTVSFDANGGTGTMESLSVNKGEQLTLPACSFVAPEGKTFDYWLISSVKYQPGDKITVVGDTLIKASWKSVEQEQPKDNEQQSQEEQKEDSSKGFVDKILEAFQNFFNKIVEFFQNLFSKTSK